MKKYLSLFISLAIITISITGCSSSLSDEKIYEIYTAPLRTNFEFIDSETDYSDTNLKTQSIKIYLRLFENGIANGIIESDDKVYSLSGEYDYLEATKVTNETYYVSLESNRKGFDITIDNDTKDVRATTKSGVFQNLNTTIEESDLSIEAFNNLYEQGSSSQFSPLSFYGSSVYSTDFSDYWLSYFGYQDIVNKRLKDREEEELRIAAEEERRKKVIEERERLAELNDRICNSIKNYDLKQYLIYAPNTEMKDLELARKAARGEVKIGGKPYARLYLARYSVGYIFDKGVVVTDDGVPYVGPFTSDAPGNLWMGAFNIHGLFGKLELLPNKSVDQYIGRCD
tara:strand:+ start:128 stop:1153 length:1026 start_codon:yes stop_codon:yes gene_type:complete